MEAEPTERDCVEQAMAGAAGRGQIWALAVSSGSRNLDGWRRSGAVAAAFADLPGELQICRPAPVDTIDAAQKPYEVHGGTST
jgi:hypothetical protein